MTVRIVNPGQLPEKRVYRLRCTHCGTEFECLQEDMRFSSDQRDGDAMSVNCPLPGCGRKVWTRGSSDR